MEFTKRIILILVTVILVQTANAQLRKVETHEDVKIFNAVLLQKTIIESDKTEYYSFFIPQEEDHGSYIVLFLGSKEEMLMNLQDLLTALRTATKGEVYEFHCMENIGERRTDCPEPSDPVRRPCPSELCFPQVLPAWRKEIPLSGRKWPSRRKWA